MKTQTTHNGVAPELWHLIDPHGAQQHFPDVQFKHVADHYLHGGPDHFAVVYHRAFIVTQLGAEVKRHLEQKQPQERRAEKTKKKKWTKAVQGHIILSKVT